MRLEDHHGAHELEIPVIVMCVVDVAKVGHGARIKNLLFLGFPSGYFVVIHGSMHELVAEGVGKATAHCYEAEQSPKAEYDDQRILVAHLLVVVLAHCSLVHVAHHVLVLDCEVAGPCSFLRHKGDEDSHWILNSELLSRAEHSLAEILVRIRIGSNGEGLHLRERRDLDGQFIESACVLGKLYLVATGCTVFKEVSVELSRSDFLWYESTNEPVALPAIRRRVGAREPFETVGADGCLERTV